MAGDYRRSGHQAFIAGSATCGAMLTDTLMAAAVSNEPPGAEAEDGGSIRVRTVWISDLHLGTPGCQAGRCSTSSREVECEQLFLVGDIVDGWQLRRSWYWPQAHNDVVQKLLRKARKGTRVIFVPGNHDEFARHYVRPQLRRHRGGATSGSTRPPTAASCGSCTATCSTASSSCAKWLAHRGRHAL